MQTGNNSGFLGGVGDTLLRGLSIAIDGEAQRRYGNTGGAVATQDRSGNLTSAGQPFRDTVTDVVSNPLNLLGIAAVIVLSIVLVKRL